MAFVLRPPTERPDLAVRLGELGRSRRRTLLARGWFRLLAVAGAGLFLFGLADTLIHLPAVARALALVGWLVAIVVTYRRQVVPARREPVHPLSVAMLLEEQFPRLNDSLASAVDFLGSSAGEDPLPRFRQVAILRAENLSRRYDFDRIVPSGSMWKAFWLMAITGLVVVPSIASDRARSELLLTRFADPYGVHPWPTATRIRMLEPERFPGLLAKGEGFNFRCEIDGVIPETASIQVRLAGATAPTEEVLPLDGPHWANGQLTYRLDAARVPREFEFRIQANDADTGWLPVEVAPAPRLIPLDGRASPQIRLEYPTYTDLAPAQLLDGTGVVDAVAGTVIHFRAAADRRIVRAVLVPQFDLTPLQAATSVACLSSMDPRAAILAQQIADTALAPIAVPVTGPEGTLLEADFIPSVPGLYALRFTDERGLTGVRLFDLRLTPDPSPTVRLERPAAGRDSLSLLPTASLTIKARTEDRIFAARNLGLEYRVGPGEGPFRLLPMIEVDRGFSLMPALGGGLTALRMTKPIGIDVDRTLPLSRFRKPDGSALVDGDRITLRAVSQDWDDRTALKEPGRSNEIEIRVLSRSSIEAQVQSELAALRPDLLRLREDQRKARDKVEELGKAPNTPEKSAQIGPVEQAQRQIRNKIADPAEGLRRKAEQLRQMVQDNALPRSPTTDKVDAVAQELGQIGDQHLESTEPLLEAARQEATRPEPAKTQDLLGKVARHQKAIEDGLNRLLERLEEWGGAGEIRGDARALKDQLAGAEDQARKATEGVTPGKTPAQLTPTEKRSVDTASDKLGQMADRSAEMMNKAARIAREKETQAANQLKAAKEKEAQAAEARKAAEKETPGSDAAAEKKAAADALQAEADTLKQNAERTATEAKALRESIRQAGGQALPEDLRRAADALRENRQGESAAARQSAAARLDQLAEGLTQPATESVDELKKKERQAANELDQIAAEQDELRKKVKQASANPDPAKRAEELQKLAREQETLRRKAEQLAQKLTRERQNQPAEALRRSAERMDAAREELEAGRDATPRQEEALDRLDEGLQKLDREQKSNEEQLTREKREQIAEQLKLIREKQSAALDESRRLQAAATKAKGWERPMIASLKDLEGREKTIAEEIRSFAKKNLEDLPVFNKLTEQSARAIDRAVRVISERRDDLLAGDPYDAEADKLSQERVEQPMKLALRRLDQILDTLKEDGKPKPMEGQPAGGGMMPPEGGGGEGGGMPPGGGGIPPLAQIKALRAMQAEINERTAEFHKLHPDATKLTEDEQEELKELELSQREIAELFQKLTPLLKPQVPEVGP